MTTLPQTTTVRVPQPAVSGGTAPAAYGPSAVNATSFQMSGADVWRVIRANLWLIIMLVILCGAAGYLLYRVWLANWPSYTAVGLLEVRTEILTDPVNEKIRDMSDARLVIQARTQAEYLRSEVAFSEAVKNEAIRQTKWFAQSKDVQQAKKDLRSRFRAYAVPDTAILQVSMTTADPKDAVVIVKEMVDSLLRKERERAASSTFKRNQALTKMKDQYDLDIKRTSDLIRDQQLALARQGGAVEGMFSMLAAELSALLEARFKAKADSEDADGAYTMAQSQLAGNGVPFEVQQAIDKDPILNSLTLERLRRELEKQVVVNTWGQDHKEVAKINAAIAEIENQIQDRRKNLRVTLGEQYLAMLEGTKNAKQSSLTALERAIAELKARHEALSSDMIQLTLNKETVQQLNQQRQILVNALSGLTQSNQDPDNLMRINWAQEPLVPDFPSSPKLFLVLPVSIFIGLSLGLGIAFLRELLDDTVRSPRDVSRVGQMNVLGMIADGDDDPQVADAKLPIFDAPHSLTAEQFRQVRTRLQHATALDTTRSIMVTGPSPMDGKTTVAANLAAGLALNGRKILLVDANFRRPEIHRLFSIANTKGFSDVLNGTSAFDECVNSTRIPNLSILPSGPKPLNVTELFESQLLVDFIERALEEFDHVIFDSAPFLVVSESVAMAPRVDGVITVIRAHSESRGLLQRMRDALKQVSAGHIGVVVNAVRAQGGGYYGRNIKTYYTYNNEG